MSLEKKMRIEDLELELQKLSNKFEVDFNNEKAKFIEKTKKDFIDYFKSKKFELGEVRSNFVMAHYGGIKVSLNLPFPCTNFLGFITLFELSVKTDSDKKYGISVNELGTELGVTSTLVDTKMNNSGKDELDIKIESLEKQLQRSKEELDNKKDRKLAYRVYDKEEANINPIVKIKNTKQFIDFKNLLDSVII